MKPKPHTLLCTVGTSLFDDNLRQLDRLSPPPRNAVVLKDAFQGGHWRELGREFASLDPAARRCEAEVNILAHPCTIQSQKT